MTSDTKTSHYILNGDTSQDKYVARVQVLYGIGVVMINAQFRVERKHCRTTVLLHLGNV